MLLMESLRDTFRDSHEAADQLAEGLREHVDASALIVPLDAGSERLAAAVAERLEGCFACDVIPERAPHTVVIVAERIRRIGPIDAMIADLLGAGAERLVLATPLAESAAAYAVDDRADAFVCLRRTPELGMIHRWYDRWTFGSFRPRTATVIPFRRPLRAVI